MSVFVGCITEEKWKLFFEESGSKLKTACTHLKFIRCDLTDSQTIPLLNFIEKNPVKIHSLILKNNQITDRSAFKIAELIKKNLWLKTAYPSTISLANNNLSKKGIKAILYAILEAKKPLWFCDLTKNISQDQLIAIYSKPGLQCHGNLFWYKTVEMWRQLIDEIHSEEMKPIKEWAENEHITPPDFKALSLKFKNWGLSKEVIISLLQAVQNDKRIVSLDIHNNRIDEKMIEEIEQIFRKSEWLWMIRF